MESTCANWNLHFLLTLLLRYVRKPHAQEVEFNHAYNARIRSNALNVRGFNEGS